MTVAKRLTERVDAPFVGSTVDRLAGTIGGVVVCGFTSLNGRDYPAAMFRRDFAKYEGRPVNCDHGRDSTVDRRLGWFSGVAVGQDGKPRGTLNLLKSHPMFERVMEAAERNPKLFGFSHVAMCRTKPGAGGREAVEAIDEVVSIDLVADPATTQGLFEGKHVAKISLKAFIERFGAKWGAKKWADATQVVEDMGPLGDAPVLEDPAADAGGDLKAALMSALTPLLEEAFESGNGDKAASALKDFIKLHAKHNGTAAKDAPADDTAAEGKKPVSLAGALAEAKSAGVTATTEQLVALTEIPTAAGRATLLAALKTATEGAGREAPKSTPRAGTTTAAKAPVAESKVPADPKAFASRYRS